LGIGVQILARRTDQNSLASIFLLTDGQDSTSHGVLTEALRGLPKNTSVHTFGLGADHDARVMKTIAERCHSTFTYVEKFDVVGAAFAATLGGLLSCVAVGLKARFDVPSGYEIRAVHSKFEHSIAADAMSAQIALPDLFAGEARDIVFALGMPPLAVPGTALIVGTVKYCDPNASADFENVISARTLEIDRPAVANAASPVNVAVNAQRNRVLATNSLETAAALAATDLPGARETIKGAIASISASPSAGLPLCVELLKDLNEALSKLATRETFNHGGMARIAHTTHQISQQRQTAGVSNTFGYNACQERMMTGYAQTLSST